MKVKCPICGAKNSRPRFTAPFDCKTFEPTAFGAIYECSSCSAGFAHPRPTSDETNAFYELDSYYTQGGSHMPDTGAPGLLSKIRMHLAWRVEHGQSLPDVISARLPTGASIVDIGCGGGKLLHDMAAKDYRMTGVERDINTISRKSANVQVLEGTAERLPNALQRNSHDGIVFSHVIEHLVDPVQAVRSATSLLKTEGLLFCEVPNNESMIAKQSGVTWEHLDAPRHINFFDVRSLHQLMDSAGLSVQQTYFSGYNRYFHDNYIATEQRIYDEFVKRGWTATKAKRNSSRASWLLLARTAFANDRSKYDSIGVVASLR